MRILILFGALLLIQGPPKEGPSPNDPTFSGKGDHLVPVQETEIAKIEKTKFKSALGKDMADKADKKEEEVFMEMWKNISERGPSMEERSE